MNKERSPIGHAVSEVCRAERPANSRVSRLGLVAALGATLVLCGPDVPRAQQRQREPGVTVTGISASGNTVTVTASGSLNRAQTWQDPEGFHIVLPNGQTALGGAARGVKVQRVGNSLELIVPVKPGANVTVRPGGERLDLVMSGGGEASAQESAGVGRAREAAQPSRPQSERPSRRQNVEQANVSEPTPQPRRERPQPVAPAGTDYGVVAGAAPKSAPVPVQQPAPAGAGGDLPPAPDANASHAAAEAVAPPPVEAPAASANLESGSSLGSVLFTLPSVLALGGLALLGALAAFFLRRRRRDDDDREFVKKVAKKEGKKEKQKPAEKDAKKSAEAEAATPFEQSKGDRRRMDVAVPFDRRRAGAGAQDQASREQKTLDGQSKGEAVNPALPAVAFGAYRIDQEVALLVSGRAHNVEVISSRALDDRRAVATSLQKALRDPDEDVRRRARIALEDYGFVARECASLLLGSESFERASAAQVLGEMRSPQALPFLTEALYDAETVVRMAAVHSLGSLGLPSAIGALLDTARRHPEIPAAVIGPALTACSVESLEVGWASPAESQPPAEWTEECAGDVRMVAPMFDYEELPDWLEDEVLAAALSQAESVDASERAHAAQALAQFQVRRAVEALSRMATEDAEGAVRATAVTSLGLINHESVFVAVIVAMADGAREVRAAAARALSRLSFDRADAYVRVFETADARALREVARACVAAGLAAQAIDRLCSEDRRQGYEAFSLLSLVVKAGEVQPLLDAIESHRDINVRLACVGLLGQSREDGLSERLHRLADSGGVPERVRAALHECVEQHAVK